ncbi:glycosyltransferase family 39 protein [Candidatus Woesearchaeota archaeon]|nr:glycosyltransferase family 39 protein [Candidatus Woesearchaeota archaeon]MCF7900760.1 glycosyltransferase family 39 protein [Candidatus Woesearchaeota archaeon]MCF8012925.1 glycosyltransferase family 39 protein [Candidatus Woesearchaeota archaeon]
MNKKTIILIVLLLLSLFIRGYSLGNDSFWIDESYKVLAAKNIDSYGIPMFDSGVKYMRAFPQSYALYLIGSNFGFNEIAMRILSVVIGAILIYVMFLLGKNLINENVGLFTAFLGTFSYFLIAWSRQARMYIFVLLFFYLTLLFYFKFYDESKLKELLISLICIFIGGLFHPVVFCLVVLLPLHYLLFNLWDFQSKAEFLFKKIKVHKGLFLLIIGILSILIFYALNALNSFNSVNYYFDYWKFIFSTYIFILPFIIAGIFYYKKSFSKNILFLAIIIVVFVVFSFYIDLQNFRYLIVLLPLILLLTGQGIYYLFELIKDKYLKIFYLLIILFLLFNSSFVFIPQKSYALEHGTPQPPFREAYSFVSEEYSNMTLIVAEPAVSELYFKKGDFWIAVGYDNKGIYSYGFNTKSGKETYTNITAIVNVSMMPSSGIIVIDDFGLDRTTGPLKEFVLDQDLVKSFGDRFWNTVYIYEILD